jgi:hypothetical protein
MNEYPYYSMDTKEMEDAPQRLANFEGRTAESSKPVVDRQFACKAASPGS